MPRFTGKVALVTGAASGIGAAIAMLLASDGAFVWCADLDPVAVAHNIEASGAFDQLIAFEHPTTTVPLAARNRSSVQRLLGAPDAAS